MKRFICFSVCIIFLLGRASAQEQEYHSRLNVTTSVGDTIFGLPVLVQVLEDTGSFATVLLSIISKDSSLRVELSIKRTTFIAGDFMPKSPLSQLPCWDIDGVLILKDKKLRETEIVRLELGFGLFAKGECSYDFSLETLRPESEEYHAQHISTLRGGTLMYIGDFPLCGNPYISEKVQSILDKRGQ